MLPSRLPAGARKRVSRATWPRSRDRDLVRRQGHPLPGQQCPDSTARPVQRYRRFGLGRVVAGLDTAPLTAFRAPSPFGAPESSATDLLVVQQSRYAHLPTISPCGVDRRFSPLRAVTTIEAVARRLPASG